MGGNRGVAVMSVVFALAILVGRNAEAFEKKPKMIVELHALDYWFSGILENVDAYLILPDGTHLHGICFKGLETEPCIPESFKPERRALDVCAETADKKKEHCAYQENYYADRKGNELTLYAANGKVTYKIVSSW